MYQFIIGLVTLASNNYSSCKRGCLSNSDCPADQACNRRTWECVETRCNEPYQQDNGRHVDFPNKCVILDASHMTTTSKISHLQERLRRGRLQPVPL